MRAERPAELLLHRARRLQQLRQVDPGRRSPSRAASRRGPRCATLPVDPAGTGQPPSSPKLDSKLVTPASSAASTFGEPRPRVLWKWAVSSAPGSALRPSAGRGRAPGAGLAIPVVSPKAISSQPAACSRPRQLGDARRVDDALVRAAEGGRDRALGSAAPPARALDDARHAGERVGDRAVDVAAVVRLAGGEEDVDLVEALAQRERRVEPALVRDQHRDRDRVGQRARRAAPRPRRRAAGSRRRGRTRSPPAASRRPPRAARSARP